MSITHGWTSSATPDGSDVTPTNMNNHTVASDTITEAMLSISDNTTKDVSSTAHGFAPKGDGDTAKFLNANGAYSTPAAGPADYVSGASGTGQITIPGMAGSPDVSVGGAGDDEFDSTDTSDPIAGWTTLGSPTAIDTNSTVKSHLYLQKDGGTNSMVIIGPYKSKSPAFTFTTKVSATLMIANYARCGIFVAEAAPGKVSAFALAFNDNSVSIDVSAMTNPTTFSSTPATVSIGSILTLPVVWLRIVVTSSTDLTFAYSVNGLLWRNLLVGYNPGYTVGAAGFFVSPQNSTAGNAAKALFDYARFT